jgi:hypothetical protein
MYLGYRHVDHDQTGHRCGMRGEVGAGEQATQRMGHQNVGARHAEAAQ